MPLCAYPDGRRLRNFCYFPPYFLCNCPSPSSSRRGYLLPSVALMTKTALVFALLTSLCSACSPALTALRHQHAVTAVLNDTLWYGRVNAAAAVALNDSSCAEGKLLLLLSTNQGYLGDQFRLSPEVLAMQAGDYVPRQRLTFYNVPARRGKYPLRTLAACGGVVRKQGDFALLGNGSALVEAYFLQPGKLNWVRITRIDSAARLVTGKFRATLLGPAERVARFRKERLRATWPK